MVLVPGVDLTSEVVAGGPREFALLIQEVEDSGAFGLDQLDTVLIVRPLNLLHVQTLFLIQILFLVNHKHGLDIVNNNDCLI